MASQYSCPASVFRSSQARCLTAAEEMLWQLLRNKQVNNFKFRRQHPLGNYIADFYCHEAKVVIELDGE